MNVVEVGKDECMQIVLSREVDVIVDAETTLNTDQSLYRKTHNRPQFCGAFHGSLPRSSCTAYQSIGTYSLKFYNCNDLTLYSLKPQL